MEYREHVDAGERSSLALTAALRAGPLDLRVPTCPDWTLVDLGTHVGQFAGFWAHVLCEGTGRAKTPYEEAPSPDGLADWHEEVSRHLFDQLRATPPDTSVWTWMPSDQSAAFVARRVAHELALHRFDAQLARGQAEHIAADLAADGIEEVFTMIAARGTPDELSHGETLHLHGLDRGDEWLVTLGPDRLRVERRHAKGDLALRGAVADLELTLYQRPALGPVERLGDEDVLAAWYRAFTFG
jgi:uncharacterized protein (TIGR03083 family)